jgi:GNAT superfamily N-acetyltransferase
MHVPLLIREANPSDFDALCPLYWAFHEHHADQLPDRVRSTGPFERYDRASLHAALIPVLESSEAIVFVADRASRLVGFAEARLWRDDPHPARVRHYYAHLAALFVMPPYRRQGIGARLIDEVEAWAAEYGATELRLDVWEYEEGPLSFYERGGYRPLSHTLVKPIKDDSWPAPGSRQSRGTSALPGARTGPGSSGGVPHPTSGRRSVVS